MEKRLRNYFRKAGFKKLYTESGFIETFFLAESGYVNVVMCYDADALPDADQSYYRQQAERLIWRFHDSGQSEVHLLTLILTSDGERGALLSAADRFCWILDRSRHCLVIPEGSVENFYGIRDELLAALSDPSLDDLYMEEPIEFEAGGKPCFRHIGQRALANHALLILNLLGYALCIMFTPAIYDWGDLRFAMVLGEGQWYRIFTSMFMHADPSHLGGNMIMLLLLGNVAERAFGHIKYLILYLTGGILAAFTSMYICFLRADGVGAVGASGAICAVIGAVFWVLIRNHGRLEMLETKKLLFLIAYLLYFGFTSTGVDNAAHVGGLLGGFLLAVILYRKKRTKPAAQRRGKDSL